MKLFFKLNIFIFGLFFNIAAFAQENKPVPLRTIPVKKPGDTTSLKRDSTISNAKGVKQKDLTDVLEEFLNVQPTEKPDTVTTKPSFSVVPALGYTLVSRLAFVLSGNMAFRTGPQSRISTIVASSAITQNKQFTFPIQSNIWSKNNTYNFVGDYRYYKYPQSTYGLGSSSNIKNEDPMDYSYFQFYETVLRHIAGNVYLGLGYIFDNHWDVSEKGNLDGTISDYSRYGGISHDIASGFTFNGLLDSRDNAINPSKGGYVAFQYRDNYSFLGSTTAWRSLIIDARKYFKFPEGSDNVLAFWNYEWLILSGKPAYLDLPSTQWDTFSATGRGYIQGRFRGADMVYLEGEYRYKITANGLIGGVVFINGESLSAAPGTKLQGIQPGFGPGLRIKLNTISKTNISIDYGFGRQGSNGLFIDVGEIF
jgi:outer membrane protein assembly factor BamA